MGLFNRSKGSNNVNGESKNFMESLQSSYDTNTLIYLDPCQDFNTNSVITVKPNMQAIFIKNGEIYGILPAGRHEIKTENYPVLSRIRNMLSGGQSTFTCQIYHVSTNEQNVNWGTATAIEIQDFFLGRGEVGVPTLIRGSAEFRVRFNILEDDNASIQTFMRLMGDKSVYTTTDLSMLFRAQIAQEVSNVVGHMLENISMSRSINAISSQLKAFSQQLNPSFEQLFREYGFELVNFSFYNLTIDETEERKKYLDRRIAAANVADSRYNQAVQQELLKDIAVNPGAGGLASAGAGVGMGMAAGNAFATMATTAFAQPQQTMPQPSMGFGSGNRFGTPVETHKNDIADNSSTDPFEVLSKLKQLLDAGLISQQQYDAKVTEIMNKM